MLAVEQKNQNQNQNRKNIEEASKLELYRLIGEGYKAMQEGRTSTMEEVLERIEKRRADRG